MKSKGMQSLADILEDFDPTKAKYISREFQDYGYRLAEELSDLKHKALYIKLAKEIPRPLLEEARNFVKDATNVKNRAKLFMWKLAALRKEKKKNGKVFIGTSGFSYPHWQGIFYPQNLPQREWFGYYVNHFKTVELNVSFYRLPKKETFVNWRKQAGPPAGGFVFSVKGSRYITHVKKLKDCGEPVKTFFEAVVGLESGVVLWQLPPRFRANPERLVSFLRVLPKSWRHAFEFRDGSWNDEKVFAILREYKAAVVIQDYPGWPVIEEETADFVYLRFHGKTDLYSSLFQLVTCG